MRKWHRIGGLLASFFLVIIAVTGVYLNHARQDQELKSGEWRATKAGLFRGNERVRLQYPGDISAILIDPDNAANVTVVLKEDWWFRSEDGGAVWKAISLPKPKSGVYNVIKSLHSGWIAGPALSYIHDAAAVILVILVISGIWLYFNPVKPKSRKKK